MAGVRGALTALYQASGTGPGSYQWLVANNYSTANLGDFADLAGVPRERVFRGTVARHGHVFTADGLINLAALTAAEQVAAGDGVLVLSTGPFSWGAIGLQRNEN
jgi:3-oxoacyl-[acyl-carrier-protein] synthase-3